MAFAILCTIAPGTLDTLKALRGQHLSYIQAHLDEILFGGPTRTPDGLPERMLIVLKTGDRAAAETFIRAEPYTASGVVFADVQITPWSQVVPEPTPGALADAIAAEQRLHPQQLMEDPTLANIRVLIVGGSAGMGFAIAQLARARGAGVIIAARNPDKLRAAAERLGPGGVRALSVDTTDEASVHALFESAGEVDHLFIPGTALKTGPWKTMSVEDVLFSLRGKFVGPFLCARHVRLRPGGSVTFWSGILSRRPGQNDALLAGVNAAVEGMTRALARDMAPIRVNCISPGMVAGTDAYLSMPEAAREGMYAAIAAKLPAGRVGNAENIASLALEVATNPFITGTVVDVDGGGMIA